MEVSSLTDRQFMTMTLKNLEKRIVAYYEKNQRGTLLLRETAMLFIRHTLSGEKQAIFPCQEVIRQLYLKEAKTGEFAPWFVYLWSYFKNYFTEVEILFFHRLLKAFLNQLNCLKTQFLRQQGELLLLIGLGAIGFTSRHGP